MVGWLHGWLVSLVASYSTSPELSARGIVIYPGKLTKAECFRLGSIGRLFPSDMRLAVLAIRDVLDGMGVRLPVMQKPADA